MIKPLGDKVLIKMSKEEISKGGIILNNNSEKSYYGVIIEVSNEEKIDGEKYKMYVKKDDKVIFNKYSGTEISYNGEEYLIISQKDILAIIE